MNVTVFTVGTYCYVAVGSVALGLLLVWLKVMLVNCGKDIVNVHPRTKVTVEQH